jgi:membrane-bound lytic murein transglycosylase D
MATESGGKVHAYSRAGAVGPLQFMPATARRYGLGTIDGFDTRLDPARATRASARYLVDHLGRFHGNLELTLAAYNAGETRLRGIQRRHRGAGFWDAPVYYSLPAETRSYVPRVLAAARLFLHPAEYGVGLPEQGSTVTTVRLGSAASLGEIAVCLGNQPGDSGWFRALRNLNPSTSPAERIPAGERIDLPTAVVDSFAASCGEEAPLTLTARALHDAEYPEKPEVVRYTVRRGDTLAAIAGAHRSSVRELAALNGIRPPAYVIHPGQRLIVPARD